jgi:hypothetical protein
MNETQVTEYSNLTERLLDLAQTKGALQERTRINNLLRTELKKVQKMVSDLKSQQRNEQLIDSFKKNAVALRNVIVMIQPE